IIRLQLKHGLAISPMPDYLLDQLEHAQNKLIYCISGGSQHPSIQVVLHLTKLPRSHLL
ncbi:hypothetical protein EDC96DRAFT_445422, partial [Choanephora cucurbitarum]